MSALKKVGHADLISKMNFPIIYAEYLSEFPEFAKDFELFLQSKYSVEEIRAIKTQMNAHTKKLVRSKWRYWAKVYSIYFCINKFLHIERFDAETVSEALAKLESRVDDERKNGNSLFYQILNS